MGRRLVIDEALTPAQQVAEAIITGQQQAIGDLAYTLADQVPGLVVRDGEPPQVIGDAATVLDALVREYAAVSGAIGPRLCFLSAEPLLARHPELRIDSFSDMQPSPPAEAAGRRRRWFGLR